MLNEFVSNDINIFFKHPQDKLSNLEEIKKFLGGRFMNETAWQALELMWKGMAGIFTVIIILTILVYLITRLTKDPDQ